MVKEKAMLTVEYKNDKPIDVIDFTTSLMAIAQSFQDYADTNAGDPLPDNMRLYVSEMRSGSVIANFQALTEQASWVSENIEVLAGFAANTNEIIQFFLTGSNNVLEKPTTRQAKQIQQIVDPIAKDGGAQININVSDGGKVVLAPQIHLNSQDSNAIQNRIARYLGPDLPASAIHRDVLLVLEQVRNRADRSTGDRGIIETIDPRAVKLRFSSEETKKAVLEMHENPLQMIFIVDVESQSVSGRPQLYRVLAIKEAYRRDID